MATVVLTPGATEITCKAQVSAYANYNQLYEPPGGLYPLRSAAYEVDEYRIMAGWPVPVPPYDVQGNSVVSALGEVIDAREIASSLVTGAAARWVSEEDYWVSNRWLPCQDPGVTTVWEGTTEYAPVLITDYSYRVGPERFYTSVLNFDSDTRNHLYGDFGQLLSGAGGYSVIMVLNPNSSYGNDLSVPYNGLWCPGRRTPAGETFTESIDESWFSVTIQGQYLYFETETMERSRVISIAGALNDSAPLYIAMVFARPDTTFYVGTGPSAIRSTTMQAGEDPVPVDSGILLGRSTGDVLHTADMAVLEVGVYADILSGLKVRDEIAILSRAYGGDS